MDAKQKEKMRKVEEALCHHILNHGHMEDWELIDDVVIVKYMLRDTNEVVEFKYPLDNRDEW